MTAQDHSREPVRSVYANEGDSISTADDVTAGDIVYLERVGTSSVLLRIVTAEILPRLTGPMFVLVQRDDASAFFLREVCRDDLA